MPNLAFVPAERRSVHVRVPATSANLGPGYDCMGMSLDIWNDITVSRLPADATAMEMEIAGEGAGLLPTDHTNLVVVGVKAAFKAAGKLTPEGSLPHLKYVCVNRIPFARGLGSSSAAAVGGLLAGLVLCGFELPAHNEEAVLQLASEIEGHPDNAAPCIYGGIQIGFKCKPFRRLGWYGGSLSPTVSPMMAAAATNVSRVDGSTPTVDSAGTLSPRNSDNDDGRRKDNDDGWRWHSSRVSYPADVQAVLFLPDLMQETCAARGILSADVPREDAVHNVSRSALLVNALTTGRLHELGPAMDDRLHQPQRAAMNPHLMAVIDAATKAGAHGACLSGAGSAVLSLCSGAKGDIYSQRRHERVEQEVAEAILAAAEKIGVTGRVFITRPSEKGAHVVGADPPYSNLNVLYFGACSEAL